MVNACSQRLKTNFHSVKPYRVVDVPIHKINWNCVAFFFRHEAKITDRRNVIELPSEMWCCVHTSVSFDSMQKSTFKCAHKCGSLFLYENACTSGCFTEWYKVSKVLPTWDWNRSAVDLILFFFIETILSLFDRLGPNKADDVNFFLQKNQNELNEFYTT